MRPSRRQFVCGAPALAAAAVGGPVRLTRKVRLGILDVEGHLGEIVQPLGVLPDVEVAAIAHPDEQVAARLRQNPRLAQARHYADWRRMLDAESLDVVGVCTPNGPRAEVILACLDHNVHVIAEKPIALSRQALDGIRKRLQEKGLKLSTLLPMRFSPPYLALKKIVNSGAIGEVINISSQKSYKAGNRPAWMRKQQTYGGTIPWIGIHMIDLMRFTSGREFTEVFSYRAQIQAPEGIGEMENTTGSLFQLDNRGIATLHMDYCRPESAPTHGDDRLRLAGTRGVAEYQAATGVTLLAPNAKPEVIRDLPPAGSVFVDFLEHVYNGKPAALPFEEVYRSTLATIAAQEAAVSGRVAKV